MERETLYLFFEGKTSPEQDSEIRSWVESSEDNRKDFFRERKIFDAMIVLPQSQKYEVLIKNNYKAPFFRIFYRRFMKIAAVIIFTLSATLFVQYRISDSKQIIYNTIRVPAGQRSNVILSDGTNIWLNALSTLKYPSVFKKGKREILLDGEAYLEVAHNKDAPFIVHTRKCNVQVLGTKFNIEAYSKSNKFETSLIEGSVKVSLAGDNSRSVILSPNMKVDLLGGMFVVSTIDDIEQYRWKDGLICFRDYTFSEIMSTFEKYFDVKIKVLKPGVKSFVCTGKFRQSEGIDYAFRVLQKEIAFKFKRDNINNSVIYIY
ncbi:MAG: FecR family protein [Bacteroidales bacterium]|nr:FecR family protein [Bacteroidales bacterium]